MMLGMAGGQLMEFVDNVEIVSLHEVRSPICPKMVSLFREFIVTK